MIHIGLQSGSGVTPGKSAILFGMNVSANDLPDDIAALKAMLLLARAENAALASENLRFKRQNERFAHILRVLRRAHFGRSSEKISDDQLNLALEDVQTGFAVENAKAEKANDIVKRDAVRNRRANRGHLPAHLPREEIVIEPPNKACPCCGGDLHQIGEDRSERLDKVPAKLRVLVTRRPKYACRVCEKTGADDVAGVVQATAPTVHRLAGCLGKPVTCAGLTHWVVQAKPIRSRSLAEIPLRRDETLNNTRNQISKGLRAFLNGVPDVILVWPQSAHSNRNPSRSTHRCVPEHSALTGVIAHRASIQYVTQSASVASFASNRWLD